jgi:predicted glycosyltransferase
MKIWFDLENSPHPFILKPVIEECHRRGFETLVTARDYAQTFQVAEVCGLDYIKAGRQYQGGRVVKLLGLFARSLGLLPLMLREKPDVALSHGSRTSIIIGKLLRIPSVILMDYEWVTALPFLGPDYIFAPDLIDFKDTNIKCREFFPYPGIKEYLYVPDFKVQDGFMESLGLSSDNIIVTIRPPAQSAHYYVEQSGSLYHETLDHLTAMDDVQMVILPRDDQQARELASDHAQMLESGRMIIPDRAVDGLNLIWHSDLVVSGGGTMNREAAALGVPVYSIFGGTVGAVDARLMAEGRLVMLQDSGCIHNEMKVVKRDRPSSPAMDETPTRAKIFEDLFGLFERFRKEPAPAAAPAAADSGKGGRGQ